MLTAVDCAEIPGFVTTVAITRTVVACVPLVTVVFTKPFWSLTAAVGLRLSDPLPDSVNWTATPDMGLFVVLFTSKTSVDCSGKPDPRTPMNDGVAPKNWIEPAGGVAVAVAVPAGVKVATPDGKGLGVAVLVGVYVGGGVAVTVGVGVGRVSGNVIVVSAEITVPFAVITLARMVMVLPCRL